MQSTNFHDVVQIFKGICKSWEDKKVFTITKLNIHLSEKRQAIKIVFFV